MISLNEVQLAGYIGRTPELRTFPSGDQVCSFGMGTTTSWKDKLTGERRQATEWHNISIEGPLAKIADEVLEKGCAVWVRGSLRTRSWTKGDTKQYTTEIRASSFEKLKDANAGEGSQEGPNDQAGPEADSSVAPAPAPARKPRTPATKQT